MRSASASCELARRRGLGREFSPGIGRRKQRLAAFGDGAWDRHGARKCLYAAELDALDRPDFLNYVGVMKANLWYPEVSKALDLPLDGPGPDSPGSGPAGLWVVSGPLWPVRKSASVGSNILTFDDMLLSAWECLHKIPGSAGRGPPAVRVRVGGRVSGCQQSPIGDSGPA